MDMSVSILINNRPCWIIAGKKRKETQPYHYNHNYISCQRIEREDQSTCPLCAQKLASWASEPRSLSCMVSMHTLAPSIKPHERYAMSKKFLKSESTVRRRRRSTVRPIPAAAPVATSTANTCSTCMDHTGTSSIQLGYLPKFTHPRIYI